MSNWWDADEPVATAPPPAAQAENWWAADDVVPVSAADQQALRVEQMVKRANQPRSEEWWQQRRNDAALADADPLAKAPALISEPYRAVASAGTSIASTIARPFSKDAADFLAEQKQQQGRVSEAARADDLSPWASRMAGGIVESLTQATVAAPLGPYGIYGSFAATAANDALYEAEQIGLKGNDRLNYAALQGTIEGTIGAVFQKLGFSGMEGAVSQAVRGALKVSGKQFLKAATEETAEELLTEASHAVAEQIYGIDPRAADVTSPGYWQRMGETIVQAVGTVGLTHATARLTQNRQQIEKLEQTTVKGFVSEQEAKELNLPPEANSRTKRKQAVTERIDQLQKQNEQLEKVVQESQQPLQEPSDASTVPSFEAEVRQEQGGEDVRREGEDQVRTEQAGEGARAPEVPVAEAAPVKREVPEEATAALDLLRRKGLLTEPTPNVGGSESKVGVSTALSGESTPLSTPPEPQLDVEERVSELMRRKGYSKPTGNVDYDSRRGRTETRIREEVAQEAEALRNYPPGTTLKIPDFNRKQEFVVGEDGKLYETFEGRTGRSMGDNAGAVLRQYKPEQIVVIPKPEAATTPVSPPQAPTQPQNASEPIPTPEATESVPTLPEAAQEPKPPRKRTVRKPKPPADSDTGSVENKGLTATKPIRIGNSTSETASEVSQTTGESNRPEVMLGSGETATTSSGRKTSPFPKVDTSSGRKAQNTVARVDQWLIDNAVAEAEARGDEWNARIFRSETAKNLPQASKDSMNEYLFGRQPDVVPSIFKPVFKPSKSVRKPKAPKEPQAKKSAGKKGQPQSKPTPMMDRYQAIKQESPDSLLLMKMGDFYEAMGDDAKTVARTLGLTLTTRGSGKNDPDAVPMTGFPYHVLDGYIKKLVKEGHKVSVAEQVDPKSATDRQVTRVVTPGTLIDAPSKLKQAAEAASADAKAEAEALGKLVRGKGLPSNPMLDPEIVAAAARVVYKYSKAGTLEFAAFIEQLSKDIGQKAVDVLRPALQAEWDKLHGEAKSADKTLPPKPSSGETTGTKNAKTAEIRKQIGMGDRPPVERQSNDQWEQEAARRIKNDPDYARNLVAELNENPRPIDKNENAVIGQYIQDLQNRRKVGEDVFEELVNAVKADELGGTETSRALSSRKVERYADFSLAGLTSKYLDSVKESPSPKEMKSLAEKADQLEKLEAELADKTARLAQAEIDLQIAQAKAAKAPEPDKRGTKRDRLRKNASDAVSAFKKEWATLFQTGAISDPKQDAEKWGRVTDAAVGVVKAYTELGVDSFLELMSNIKRDFGKITTGQRDAFRDAWSKREKPEVAEQRDPSTIGELARKMTRWAVEAGIENRDAVIDAVHDDLVELGFNVSRTDTMEAISGYGSYRPLTRSEAGVKTSGIKREIRRILAEQPENQTKEEAKRAARYKKTLERSLAMWEQRRIDAGQGILPQKRKKPPVSKEILDTKLEIEAVQHRALAEIEKARRAKYNLGQWIGAGLTEATSTLPRSLMSGLERSVVLRQGVFYAHSHPIKMLGNLVRSMQATFSQRIALANMENIKSRPNYNEYGAGGVEFTHHEGPIKDWEELYSSSVLRWLESTEGKVFLPLRTLAKLYVAFERGFSDFRNTMAADLYDIHKRDTVAIREFFSKHGFEPRPWGEEDIKVTGRTANILGGRGTGLKGGSAALNWFFFARRWVWATIQREFILPFQMATPKFIGQWNADPALRIAHAKLYAQFLVGTAAHLAALYWMLYLTSDDDEEKPTLEFDPRSTDFLKPKVGETRFDVLGGMQQPIVLASRFLRGSSKGPDGKITSLYNDGLEKPWKDTSDVLIQWGRSKLGPGPSGILDWFAGQNLLDQPKTKADVITERITPMTHRELWEAEKELGLKRGTIAILEGFHGAGISTYGPRTNFRNASEAERLEIFRKDLKRLPWDAPEQPAYAEFLTDEQLEEYRDRREERKQAVVLDATTAGPVRETHKSDESFQESVAQRDKARATLKETGWTYEEAAQLLRDHYFADGRMTDAENRGYNAKLLKLGELIGR